MRNKIALIIGAGPAGLAAAYKFLTETDDIKPIILEELSEVGGISRTVDFNGCGVDLGGHRMYSKSQEILDFWENILPLQGVKSIDDKILNREVENLSDIGSDPEVSDEVMLKRRRFSRIYYTRKFFDYPVSLKLTTILNLGIIKTFLAGMSYFKSCFVKRDEKTLEDFMINRFGKVLYSTFFENYTEKVWGRHPKDISKEWGEQRIKGLSLTKAVLNALKLTKNKETTLIDEFFYPKFGCGQLWKLMADFIVNNGGEIHLNTKVVALNNENNRISSLTVIENSNHYEYFGDYVISSMPVKDLVCGLKYYPDENILNTAKNLPYRDYMLVALYLSDLKLKNNTKYKTINNICPDNWIYIQEPDVKVGRLQVMNNWSPYLVKDFEDKVLISLEYFCNENDEYWNMSDDEFINFAIEEAETIGILDKKDVIFSKRVKVQKAYPAYFDTFKDFDIVKKYLNNFENLYCIGRNGQHKYNNMDHSMLSGFEAVRIIKNNLNKEILWSVNTENTYQELK
ncbi:NAD(P)/FAD-dependent oxidoreductase [bacterium]|nr:NAD(P)/FAD-dependent oxidoreductase [bacterium]